MRPDDGKFSLWPIAVVGFLAILAVASVTPVVRLNSSAPPDFAAVRAHGTSPNPAEAQAYWRTAADVLQWKYDRTTALPAAIPSEFTLADGTHNRPEEQAARAAYWGKLRQEWLKSENWHKTVDFNASWIPNTVESVWQGVHDYLINHT
jgi:hypothetical protein